MERIDEMPDNSVHFGREMKKTLKDSFHPLMSSAQLEIERMEELADGESFE